MATIPDIKLFVQNIQQITTSTYDVIALKTPNRVDLKKIKNNIITSYLEGVIDEIDVLQEELDNIQQSLETVRRYAYNAALEAYIKTEQLDKSFQRRVTIVLESYKTRLRDIMKVLTARSLSYIAQIFPKEFQLSIDNFIKLYNSSDDLEVAYVSKLEDVKIELQYIIDILVSYEFITTRNVSESIKKLFNSHVVYGYLKDFDLKKSTLLEKDNVVIQEDHSTLEEKESPST